MGRAGAGGMGGGHASGGGHSMGHSSGGHRVGGGGGGHRAGSGGFSGGGFGGGSMGGGPRGPMGGGPRGPIGGGPRGPMGGPGMGGPATPPPPRRRRYYGGPGVPPPGPGGYRRGPGCGGYMGMLVLVLIIVGIISMGAAGSSTSYVRDTTSVAQTTTVREKLDTGNAYMNDCIDDQLGWFDNVSSTEASLKDFWQETGVQPYIILKSYDESLTTDDAKEDWAVNYYEANFTAEGREDVFLYVYFAEEDTDNEVGYMTYTNGNQSSVVMDSEAVEIFWNYIDFYWYSDSSTDDLFINVFDKTADNIMHAAKTQAEASAARAKTLMCIVIVAGVCIVGVIIYKTTKEKNRREKEKAEETERILNTPLDKYTDKAEDLASKYENGDTNNSQTSGS